MRIRWDSEVAQDVLGQLGRSARGMDTCIGQLGAVRAELSDGDSDAIRALSERFERFARDLSELYRELGEYRHAVLRADDVFDETARRARRLSEKLDGGVRAPVDAIDGAHARWSPGAYAVMPEMRVRVAPIPEWLEEAAARSNGT